MSTILITGANRGIGLELTRQFSSDGWKIHACARDPEHASELAALADADDNIQVHELDVCNANQRQNLVDALADEAIDIMLNNAGIYGSNNLQQFGSISQDEWLKVLTTNTIAPIKMMEEFLPHVERSDLKVMANISSKVGSMSDNNSGGAYIYRSSKAALNAASKSAGIDLTDRGITVVMLHPGWVRTSMGGPRGLLSVEESATQLKSTLTSLKVEDNGRYIDIDGSTIGW